ncbi:hypothetical protein J2Y54_002216 [Sphingomonas sp. BE123]|nr:hypothetical protein [Sphingomonas sp. BE123]
MGRAPFRAPGGTRDDNRFREFVDMAEREGFELLPTD